jgi:AAHS family 4-hydroxybenzoate transporter-like MFS transporter
MGHQVPADAKYTDASGPGDQKRTKVIDVLAPAHRRDTLALCASFFFCLMANYFGIMLIPSAFKESGFEQAAANRVLELFNLGGVVGALVGARLIQRAGSRAAMLGMSAAAVAVSLVLSGAAIVPPASATLMALMIVDGALLNGVQTTMYALAVHVYPTKIRGTGVGTAVAFGRIGNVLAPIIGNYTLDRGGNQAYFSSWAIAMGLVFAALAAVGRHVPPTSSAWTRIETGGRRQGGGGRSSTEL